MGASSFPPMALHDCSVTKKRIDSTDFSKWLTVCFWKDVHYGLIVRVALQLFYVRCMTVEDKLVVPATKLQLDKNSLM